MDIAAKYEAENIYDLLVKSAHELVRKNKLLEAVQLYRKANLCKQASGILYQVDFPLFS